MINATTLQYITVDDTKILIDGISMMYSHYLIKVLYYMIYNSGQKEEIIMFDENDLC